MSRAIGQTCTVNFFSNGIRQIALLAVGLALAGALTARADDPPEANPNRPAILVLGDSLAAGYGVDPGEAYPALLQKKIDAAGLDFAVIPGGVSGDTTAGGLRRINWFLRRKIDVLILELGGNDGLRGVPLEATRTNLQAIMDRARKANPDLRIVIAGMRLPPNLGQEYTAAFEKIFPDLARDNHAALVPAGRRGRRSRLERARPDSPKSRRPQNRGRKHLENPPAPSPSQAPENFPITMGYVSYSTGTRKTAML